MASKSRRTATTVSEQLAQTPGKFDFFQAVRLLENIAVSNAKERDSVPPRAVGGDARPSQEAVHFRATTSLAFPGNDILSLQPAADREHQQEMQVSLMSLSGSTGVLPFHYSELLQQRNRLHDTTLTSFLDMFNHRSLSLFYRAWKKYRYPINYESQAVAGNNTNSFNQVILSLLGLGTKHTSEQLPLSLENIISVGGFLSRTIRPAQAVEKMLQFHLGMPVAIEQFKPQWVAIPPDTRSSLAPDAYTPGVNNQLGVNAMLGSSGWQVQSKFSVKLPDLSYEQLMQMRPNGDYMAQLKTLTRFTVGSELEFDFLLTTKRKNLPLFKLTSSGDNQPILGWNTQLSGESKHPEVTLNVH